MHLTKASKFGLYALVEMAQNPGVRVSAASIAARLGLSENHFAKVLQQLGRAGFIVSTRGVGGGYELARPAEEITMAQVVRCLEGGLDDDACADCPFRIQNRACGGDPITCGVHRLLSELSEHVYYTLESVTIRTLARAPVKPSLGAHADPTQSDSTQVRPPRRGQRDLGKG